MTAILVLTPELDDPRVRVRTGDAFDTAFVETIRTLDGQGGAQVLVPWSDDLAALVAVAVVDTAPGFDPEGKGSRAETGSRIVAYRPLSGDPTDGREAFWHASHLSLGGLQPVPLAAALSEWPPTHVIVLGLPKAAAAIAAVIAGEDVQVMTFPSLADPADVAQRLILPLFAVIDLEAPLAKIADGPEDLDSAISKLDRSAEAELEPYVPYGLLLQFALDELLPGDDRESRRR